MQGRSPAVWRQLAASHLKRGDLLEAIHCLDALVRSSAANSSDFLLLGDCLWSDYRFPEALDAYQKAATGTAQPDAHLVAARRLFSLGRFSDSATALELALAASPSNPDILRMLAELRERQGRPADAEPLARAALAINPDLRRATRALALILRRLGRTDEAISILHLALQKGPHPDNWRLLIELAAALDASADYPAAIAALLASRDLLRPLAAPAHARWQLDAARRESLAATISSSDLTRWLASPPPDNLPARIAFLAGHPRSGTTLLEHLLASSPNVLTTDETGILHHEFIRPLTLDPPSTSAALSEIHSFDPDQLAAGRDFYRRATSAHLGQPIGHNLLIEKDPFLTQDLLFPLRLFPEASVIMPLRDPRDVALSFFFTIVPLAGDSTAALDLASAVQSVALSLRLWQRWKSILPQPWLEVRYESLVANPTPTIATVRNFLNLPAPPLSPPSPDHLRGVRTPSYADVSRPVHQRSVGRWHHYAKWLEPVLTPLAPLLKDFAAPP